MESLNVIECHATEVATQVDHRKQIILSSREEISAFKRGADAKHADGLALCLIYAPCYCCVIESIEPQSTSHILKNIFSLERLVQIASWKHVNMYPFKFMNKRTDDKAPSKKDAP
ncbi:hypothetical protein ACJX0J_007523, partial [Zea mays]